MADTVQEFFEGLPARAEGSENLVGAKASAGCQRHESPTDSSDEVARGTGQEGATCLTGHPACTQGMPTD